MVEGLLVARGIRVWRIPRMVQREAVRRISAPRKMISRHALLLLEEGVVVIISLVVPEEGLLEEEHLAAGARSHAEA